MPKLPLLLVFIPHLSRFVSHLKTLIVPGHVWAEPPGRIRVGAGKRANSRGSGAICCGRGATRALEPGEGHRSGAKRRNVGTKLEKITFCGLHNSNYFFFLSRNKASKQKYPNNDHQRHEWTEPLQEKKITNLFSWDNWNYSRLGMHLVSTFISTENMNEGMKSLKKTHYRKTNAFMPQWKREELRRASLNRETSGRR